MYCNSWGRKESDTTVTELNLTELNLHLLPELRSSYDVASLFPQGESLLVPLTTVLVIFALFCDLEWKAFQFSFSLSKMSSLA